MTSQQRAYLAGLLDSDGSMMIQLRPRKGMKYLFRVKMVIIFYQHTKNHAILDELRQLIQAGYVYQRNDHMSELRIEGFTQVASLVTKLQPYLRFKRQQAQLLLAALRILSRKQYSLPDFLLVCSIADQISALNYTSKLRKYTSAYVHALLEKNGLIPVTTGSRSNQPEMVGQTE